MMGRKSIWNFMVVAAMLAAPGSVAAQAMSVHQAQVADLQSMKDKFTSLGAAFPEAKMGWMPMEGTRSVKEVLVLIAAECHVFPVMVGADPATGAVAGFRAEGERLNALSTSALLTEVGSAFDYMIAQVGAMDDAAQMAQVRGFSGQQMTANAFLVDAIGDMHEHLGQLIAYARANEIVPPWSRGTGM